MTGMDGYGDPIPPGHGERRGDWPRERETDIEITHADGFDTVFVEGMTLDGIDLIDAWDGPIVEVRDSGNIIIRPDGREDFEQECARQGLKVEVTDGSPF